MFCLMTSPTHAKCTLSGYLKHLNDSYPPTGKEHSLLCCRACLLLKPPFWKNKTGYHGDATGSSHRVSGYRCVYFPNHVDSGCQLKTQVQFGSSLPAPTVAAARRRRTVPARVKNSSRAGRGGVGAVTGPEARQETVVLSRTGWNFTHYTCSGEGTESDTLHQHLQGPQQAARGAVEFYTFTRASSDASAHVSALLVWKELIRPKEKKKMLDALGAETLLRCSFACVGCILSAELHVCSKAQWLKPSRI